MSKPELRAQLTAGLRAMPVAERAAASKAICRAVREQPSWAKARLVCAFLPLSSEPQIAELWELEGAPAFCFPRIRGDDVELIQLSDAALLRRSNWKLEAEELASALVVPAANVDLFLVPGLGFTANGLRLGRGGGYYDRLLARRQPASTALGLCFACQLADTLPTELHDQLVDAVISDRA